MHQLIKKPVVLLAFLLPFFAFAQDKDDGNDQETATEISIGADVDADIFEAGDVDYFSIEITEATQLLIETTGDIDTVGAVEDDTGLELADNDDSGDDDNFQITISLDPGTYFIRVSHFLPTGTGDYTLSTEVLSTGLPNGDYDFCEGGGCTAGQGDCEVGQCAEGFVCVNDIGADFGFRANVDVCQAEGEVSDDDDHGDSPDDTNPTPSNIGVSDTQAGNEIETAGDVDFFEITLATAGLLTVESSGTTDTFGSLVEEVETGIVVLASDDDSSPNGNNFRFSYSADAGTYFIRVRHSNANGTGEYDVTTTFSEDTGLPPGDYDYCTENDCSGSDQGDGTQLGDCDSDAECQGREDPEGRGLGLARSHDESPLVCVQDVGADYGFAANVDVCLHVEAADDDDHPNTFGEVGAGDVVDPDGGTNDGEIETSGDIDYFSITTTEDGTLTVFTNGDTDTYGVLEDGSGGPVLDSDDDSGVGVNFSLTAQVPAGTYYVRVRHALSGSGTGDYEVEASFTAGDINALPVGDFDFCTDESPCAVDEGDCDTDSQCAGDLICVDDLGADFGFRATVDVCQEDPTPDDDHANVRDGDPAPTEVDPDGETGTAGNIEVAGDVDYFEVTLDEAGTLTVSTSGDTDTFGALEDSEGTTIDSDDDSGTGSNFRIEEDLAAGTYFIRVRHFHNGLTGEYTLNVSLDDLDDHADAYNATDPAPTSIGSDDSDTGVIEAELPGDVDVFEVSVAEGTLTVTITGDDISAMLLDDSGVAVAGEEGVYDLDSGTYFISVSHDSDGSGNYTVTTSFESAPTNLPINIVNFDEAVSHSALVFDGVAPDEQGFDLSISTLSPPFCSLNFTLTINIGSPMAPSYSVELLESDGDSFDPQRIVVLSAPDTPQYSGSYVFDNPECNGNYELKLTSDGDPPEAITYTFTTSVTDSRE